MFTDDDLGQFGNLSRAIGLTTSTGTNSSWFEDPIGADHPNGLKHVLTERGQRDALLEFVDEILGPPAARTVGTRQWIPLFHNADPAVTVSAVVEVLSGSVRLGVGLEHATGTTAPHLTSRIHVPLIHVPNGSVDDRLDGGPDPDWLLIGHAGGRIAIELDATFTNAAPVPREAYLRGAAVRIEIPTNAADDLEFGLDLIDLQVPGAASPTTQSLDIDHLDEVGYDVLDFVVGLVRAQAASLDLTDDTFRHIAGLTGILGLRDVLDLPALPLADLPVRGVSALVGWIEQVLGDNDARDAWLGELVRLVGGTAIADRDAVQFDLGDASIVVGIRVTAGTGGHSVLVPWAELGYATRSGVKVGGAVDLLRLDTASGDVRAIPQVRAEAVFGADSAMAAARLLATGPVQIGSVHVGVRLDELTEPGQLRPAFALTLHDVDITAGGAPRHHDVLDLSNPDAALDALDSAIDDALASALDGLGGAGTLLKRLLGIEAPVGVTDISIVDLVTDPLDAVRRYYQDLLSNATAMGEVLGSLQALVTGVPVAVPVPGGGTVAAPWRISIATSGGGAGLGLAVWRDGDHLRVALAADVSTPVLDSLAVASDLRLVLFDVDLSGGNVTFASEGVARLLVRPIGAGPTTLSLGVAELEFSGVGVEVGWRAGRGIRVATIGDGLTLVIPELAGVGPGGTQLAGAPLRIAVALPTFDAAGEITWTPDWEGVERLLGRLLTAAGVPVIDAVVDLLGWDPGGMGRNLGVAHARLSLSALIADPAVAIATWAADVALDCEHLRAVMGVVTELLSGFAIDVPYGLGRADFPYRAPIGGESAAPAIIAWTEPPCPPPPAPFTGGAFALLDGIDMGSTGEFDDALPVGDHLAAALEQAAREVPGLSDLLVARPNLGAGFDELIARWIGTDGITGPASSMPTDVESIVLPGHGYAELAALARSSDDVVADLSAGSAAVAHVGCDAAWGAGYPADEVIDATGGPTGTGAPSASIDASADGRWFVQLATPARVATNRADHDGVAGQAAALGDVLDARTTPIVLVAYGAAGAAAIRAASMHTQVVAVVTVGTPWSPISVTSMQSGLGGSALALTGHLLPDDPTGDEVWTDELLALQASPLIRGVDLVRRATSIGGPTDLPTAGAETRRAGLVVRAVFGTLDGNDVTAALVAVIATALADRAEAAIAETDATSVERPDHLHLGIDVPAVAADLGGITVGAGVSVELLHVARPGATATLPTFEAVREVVVSLQLGVTDGWLLGGPGAASRDLEVRWLEARVHLPISIDGVTPATTGFTEIVMHEARAFTAFRQRWVIRSDGQTSIVADVATTALPEVKILLGEVIGRIQVAVPTLADLFEAVGLIRLGGLDPGALDRLLFDPGATIRPLVAAAPATIASAINDLTGAPPDASRPATAIDIGTSANSFRFDLAARTVSGTASVSLAGAPPITLGVDLGPALASITASVGELDQRLGGVALRFGAALGSGATLEIQHRAPADPTNAAATKVVQLLPTADVAGLERFAATMLPATLMQAVATALRDQATDAGRTAIDAALSGLGMLRGAADEARRDVLLPIGLVTDPGAWLVRRADPLAAAVAVLDALAPIIVPGRGIAPGWPLHPAFGVTYALVAGRLELVVRTQVTDTIDGVAVVLDVSAGIAISAAASPSPIVDARVTADGWGVGVQAQPSLVVNLLRPTPATAITLYPPGAGLGSALATVGVSLLPQALNALAGHRNDAGTSLAKDVGAAVYDIGDAMALMEGPTGARQFTVALIDNFAAHPANALIARLPSLASAGLAALAHALDPTGALVTTTALSGSVRRFAFGTTRAIHVDLDGTVGNPAIDIGGTFTIDGGGATTLGTVTIEHLRITPTGAQIEMLVGPVQIALGSVVLRPILVVRAGVGAGSFTRMLGVGVGLDDDGDESVEIRWGLDATAPVPYAVTRGVTGESLDSDIGRVALRLVSVAVSLASGILAEQLGTVITDDATARLQGVVFSGGGRSIDPTFITDLTNPDRLLGRVKKLAWNSAQGPHPLSITIDGTVTLALASKTDGLSQQLGLSITLVPSKKFRIATGDVNVDLEVDASWVSPVVPAGLAIYVLRGVDADDLDLDFGVSVAGIGLRFTKTAGPLVDLGSIALDGLAIHVYGEASSSGVGGGVQLQLSGLAVAPGGGSDTNPMANSLVNDAGEAGANNRPSFSPSLSIQKHPGTGLALGLRAGDPPGPWWIVVQRQLGPIYVERIGLDTFAQGGEIKRISLLFSGSVSLFGLTAAVEQLSLSWDGGDVLSIGSWSADLMGLAVSADMAGVSLAGGLLKSVDGDGVISYVGMLVGRFATYGLSVFGGYASDPQGHASFFVFGAVTGPIGGPPAFFLTGLGGGLGINRGLVIPTELSQFATYPFIQALDPAASAPDNPMDELKKLNVYFPHQPGNFWFAAGISFTSFALVDGVAVVAVSFGDGLEINLLGLARMALPRPQAPLVSIELALLARFSTSEGVFMIKAQLTDNSWLLYEDIRLTGGFAFALWWKGPLAGQFVLTMGGYHPDFHRDGYPDVPRLGLVWKISNAIEMKGESYFALTSEALMAGTSVSVSIDFGWVWARIEFGADGIVYFDPFFFDVRAYCRISAGIDIDLGLFSISLSITIGASIHVWGPEFAGEVVFEIGPCDVPIRFGPQHELPGSTIDWSTFVGKYLEEAGGGRARALSGITGRGTLPTSTGGAQGAPSADGSAALPFQVFAEFEISFTTTVPTSNFKIGTTAKPAAVTLSNGAGTTLGLAPMGAGQLTSSLEVMLEKRLGGGWVSEPDLSKLAANLVAPQAAPDGSRFTTDAFPTGVWGQPKSLAAATKPVPSGDVVITGNRVVLVAGIDTMTQGPQIDYYQVTSGRRPLPLSATGAARSELLLAASAIGNVTATTAQEALQLAAETLFSIEGAANRGAPVSPLGRVAYSYDRVSPPRFGNLADGLAQQNGASGERQPAPVAAPKTVPMVRAPFVAGYFASGVGAAERAATTTVGDGRIKRRPAPTTESVRGRLGIHVPAVLSQAAPPAVTSNATVIAGLSVPRTDVLGSVRSVALGPVGKLGLNQTVGGLGSTGPAPQSSGRRGRAEAAPERIPTGDMVALQLPDANIDVSPQRPALSIGGRSRVVMLAAHGVVFDDDVVDRGVEVPMGTMLIGVQADGDADAADGYSGWHDRSRVAMLSERAAVGAGCTITVDGAGGATPMGWALASSLTLSASQVNTRFSRPMRTVAIALTGVAPTSLDRTEIHIIGGRMSRDRSGTERPPVMVSLGDTAVLVYGVVPDRTSTELAVVITPGAERVVSAVLGASGPNETAISVDDMAAQIARRGLAAVSARLTAAAGPGCTADWIPAEGSGDGSPATPPASGTPAATKRPAGKKTATKRPAGKKTATKRPARKKRLAGTKVAKKRPAAKTVTKKRPAAKTVTKKRPAAKTVAKKRTTSGKQKAAGRRADAGRTR